MRELADRIAPLLAVLPVALERVVRAAIGPASAWRWLAPALPVLLAVAVGVGVGALAFVTVDAAFDFPALVAVGAGALGAVVGFGLLGLVRRSAGLPLQLAAAIVGAAVGAVLGNVFSGQIIDAPLVSALGAGILVGLLVLGRRLRIERAAEAAAENLELVPAVIWLLLLLAVLPLLQAGAELNIARATVGEFVDRDVGTQPLVEIDGLALLAPFEAEPPVDPERGPDPRRYRWFPIRGAPTDRRIALVRSSIDPAILRRQTIVARVIDDPGAVRGAAEALTARGAQIVAPLSDRLLTPLDAEGVEAANDVRSLSNLAELADVAAGSIVRLTLVFPGDGVASCVVGDDCEARRLAGGIGPWDHLASDPRGAGSVVVRATYPPTLAPLHVVGRQMADPGAVDRYLSRPWIRSLLGWAQVRRGGIIQHDLSLPVDRLWLGPVIFLGLAWALGYGRRLGYPVFRGQGMRGWSWGGANLGSRDIRATASGRLAPPDRSPLQLEDAEMLIRPAAAGPSIEVRAPDGPIVAPVPRELSTWSALEVGELRSVRDRQPALRASWYGSQLQLVFESEADRDAAAIMMRADLGR
jgi:hypothetical protein